LGKKGEQKKKKNPSKIPEGEERFKSTDYKGEGRKGGDTLRLTLSPKRGGGEGWRETKCRGEIKTANATKKKPLHDTNGKNDVPPKKETGEAKKEAAPGAKLSRWW